MIIWGSAASGLPWGRDDLNWAIFVGLWFLKQTEPSTIPIPDAEVLFHTSILKAICEVVRGVSLELRFKSTRGSTARVQTALDG